MRRLLAAGIVLAAALLVSCGNGDTGAPGPRSAQPPAAPPDEPAEPTEQERERPKHPPPPAITWAHTLRTVPELVEKSTVVVMGVALEAPVPERGCRLPNRDSPGCYFQRFRVDRVLAGEFIDGTATPQTIELRIWVLDEHRVELGHNYLLFLYPFEWVPGEWFGDYQIPVGSAGAFREVEPGLFYSRIPGGHLSTTVEEVEELLESRPGLLGSKVDRAH